MRNDMVLIGFLQAQNCSNYVGSWRHPATTNDFLTPDYYQRIARTLEAGKFHLAFFDDRLAMPEGVPPGTPPHWLSYIEVDDVDASVARARSLGAEVLKEPFNVEEVGRLAIIKDPSGGVIGWITPDFND